MTKFRESFATQQFLPPWKAEKVQTSCFLFRLKPKAIQSYLDRHFNFTHMDRAPYHFSARADSQFGVITISYYPCIFSTNNSHFGADNLAHTQWDHLSYTQFHVAIPVLRHRITRDNLLVEGKTVWIQPVIICDNSSVVFGSREIIGLDMIHGSIERKAGNDPGSLHVDVFFPGFKTFEPTTQESPSLPLMHLETGPSIGATLPQAMQDENSEFIEGLAEASGGGKGLDRFLPTVNEIVTLKQFRDAFNLLAATYQAIVSATNSFINVENLQFYDANKVELEFMWSASATEMLSNFLDLGAPGVGRAPPPHKGESWDLVGRMVKPRVAFGFTSDIEFNQIKTLHTFGGGAQSSFNRGLAGAIQP